MVNYEVKMTFSNPLYSRVTRYFFDSIVVNINDAFVNACNVDYEQQMQEVYEESQRSNRTIREYIDDGDAEELDQFLRNKKNTKRGIFKAAEKDEKKADPDFKWKANSRRNRRRTQTKSVFEDEFSNKKSNQELKRMIHSQMLIRDLFRNNYLAAQEKAKIDKKMQDKQFLKDIYLLDQALGGAPEYKKKIAQHIRETVDKT